MVGPDIDYVKAEVDINSSTGKEHKKEIWIVAKALSGVLIQGLLGKKFKIVKEFKGETIEGIAYEHPLHDKIPFFKSSEAKKVKNLHTVLLSEEYVDTTAGTGLVHCAPGCGPEDFEVGKKYGLPAFNTLDEKGDFHDIPFFNGKKAKVDDVSTLLEMPQTSHLQNDRTILPQNRRFKRPNERTRKRCTLGSRKR